MLYDDKPARIPAPGTHAFATAIDATYTVGREHVFDALKDVFGHTRELAADIETFGLGLAARRLKSVAFSDDRSAIVLDPRDRPQAHMIRDAFAWCTKITFHNAPFDVPNLYLNDLIQPADVGKVIDTLPYARLANPDELVRKSLTAAGERYLGTSGKDELSAAFKALSLSKVEGFRRFDLDRPIYVQGAASDPLVTWRLLPVVRQAAYLRTTTDHPFSRYGVTGDEAWALVDREQILNRIALLRSCRGLRIDFEYLDRFREENAEDVLAAEVALTEAGIRPGNAQDLAKVLIDLGELPSDHPTTPKTGSPRMRAGDVELLPHPLAWRHLRYKQHVKIRDDYLGKVVELADSNGRIHPETGILTAATGRAAMANPPLHQFSGPARGIILPDEGDDFTSIDWSQVEPVVAATMAGDRAVIEDYRRGIKLYDAVAARAQISYKHAKVVLLAQLYGEGMRKLSVDLGLDWGPWTEATDWEIEKGRAKADELVPRFEAAKELKRAIFDAMPATEAMIVNLKEIGQSHQKVFTLSGRILTVPWAFGRIQTHKAVNYFVQGSAYDVLAEAKIRVHEAGLSDALYWDMHDELIVSSSAAHDIRKIMETPPERLRFLSKVGEPVLRTDLAHLGERWSDA